MTDAERKTFLELHEVELRAAGEQLASDFATEFALSINAGIDAAIEEFGDQDDRDLLQPALLHRIYERLAWAFGEGATGWEAVFFSNLNERYDERGEA
jgi:hypothetical protein